jgi:GNAT superfamily N-acetyltransferase
VSDPVVVRRELGRGDAEAIAAIHARVYEPEFGMNHNFCESVRSSVNASIANGWPEAGGAVWLIDGESGLAGSLALTDEGDGLGRVRWFVLAPELRGRGLGRRLVQELIAEARAAGLTRLELETFNALAVAAHIYRTAGFRLIWARERADWGRPITYQRYELELEPGTG